MATLPRRRVQGKTSSVNGLALLALGILPQPLMGLCVLALQQSHFH